MDVRKRRAFLLSIFLLAILASLAYAGPRGIQILINDKPLNTEVPARIENGRVLVPLRAVAEALGATVTWDESSRSVLIKSHSRFADNPYKTASLGAPVSEFDYSALGAVTAVRRHIGDHYWSDLAAQDPARILVRYEILYLRNPSGIAPPPLKEWDREQRGGYWVKVRLYFADFTGSPVKSGVTLWKEKNRLPDRERTVGHEVPTASRYWFEERDLHVYPKGEPVLRENTDGDLYMAELEQGATGWEVVGESERVRQGSLETQPPLVDAVTMDVP